MVLRTAADRLSRWSAAVGGVALAVMIVLITAQVVSRRFLDTPMVVADELSGYLLVVTTFSALGYALQHGDHIQVTLLVDHLSQRARNWLRVFWCLIGIPFLALLIWRTGILAHDSYVSGSFSVSATNILLWPIQTFVPAGLAVFLLQMVAELASAIETALGKRA